MFLSCFVVVDTIFYPAAIDSLVWENCNSLFIAEPRSGFKCCHEQQILENHNYIIYSILIVILMHYNVQKTDIQVFNFLYYWTGLNLAYAFCLAFNEHKLLGYFRWVFRYYGKRSKSSNTEK